MTVQPQRRNNVGIGQRSNFRGSPMACFDRLPAQLRRVLHESNQDWCPLVERWLLNQAVKNGTALEEAIRSACVGLVQADQEEVRSFSYCWPARFGRYPAVAARSSFVRYRAGQSRAGDRCVLAIQPGWQR